MTEGPAPSPVCSSAHSSVTTDAGWPECPAWLLTLGTTWRNPTQVALPSGACLHGGGQQAAEK